MTPRDRSRRMTRTGSRIGRYSKCAAIAIALVAGEVALPAMAQAGMHAIYSPDGSDVWVTADGGQLYRSLNGGDNWSVNDLGDKTLRAVISRKSVVIVAGDSGKVWRSVNSGFTWAIRVIAGIPSLRALQMPADSIAYVFGTGGTILKSVNAGATWTAQASGTTVTLNAARFLDAIHGWAVGDGGVVLRTDDGGATWSAVALGTTATLRSVDALGNMVWIVGQDNVIRRSFDGGLTWYPLDLGLEIQPDLRAVWIDTPQRVVLSGGGGFLRVTADSGATWTYMRHPLLAPIDAMYFTRNPARGWACSRKTNGIEYTLDGGVTWDLVPAGTNVGTKWALKKASVSVVRGNTLAVNGLNRNSMFCVLGAVVYKSLDRGEIWAAIDTIAEAGYAPTRANAFYVSPRDSNRWVAATQGPPDRVMRSSDAGGTWTGTIEVPYSEYGVPLEMNQDHPDTLLFAPEDGALYRSLDFGATWSTLSVPDTAGVPIFRSPCDVQIVRGENNNIWVGDGVTGDGQGVIWQSLDGGLTFTRRYPGPGETPPSGGNEIPMMVSSRLDNRFGLATHYNSGGLSRTSDGGRSWVPAATTFDAWGVDIARDDPGVALFATFGGAASLISADATENFILVSLPGANYGLLAYDRSTFLAQQSNGIYKFEPAYNTAVNNSQFLTVGAPGFGTSWPAGQVRNILWTSTNIAIARLEYRTAPTGPWTFIADAPGPPGSYAWTVPNLPTTTARVRVSDAWDASPRDSSAIFTIAAAAFAVAPAALSYGTRPVGSVTLDTLRLTNTGTATLNVTSLTTNAPGFTPGRATLSLAPGQSDTIGVTFRPTLPVNYTATLTITSNAIGGAAQVSLTGAATDTLHLTLTSPVGGESWQYKSTRSIQWQSAQIQTVSIDYQTAPGAWIAITDSVPAAAGLYAWQVPYAPTDQARVRVRERGGSARDSSAAVFRISTPLFAVMPGALDLGVATTGTVVWDTLRVSNPGTAPIMISWISSDRSEFWPGRSWMSLIAGAGDTLTIFYRPVDAGRDTATITFVTNDPFTPHTLQVVGEGAAPLTVAGGVPAAFALAQNRPNPFGDGTLIRYALPSRDLVTLEVFNLQGQRVATLVNGPQGPGEYAVSFEARSREAGGTLPSGVYFYRLRAGTFTSTRKMLLTR